MASEQYYAGQEPPDPIQFAQIPAPAFPYHVCARVCMFNDYDFRATLCRLLNQEPCMDTHE